MFGSYRFDLPLLLLFPTPYSRSFSVPSSWQYTKWRFYKRRNLDYAALSPWLQTATEDAWCDSRRPQALTRP